MSGLATENVSSCYVTVLETERLPCGKDTTEQAKKRTVYGVTECLRTGAFPSLIVGVGAACLNMNLGYRFEMGIYIYILLAKEVVHTHMIHSVNLC